MLSGGFLLYLESFQINPKSHFGIQLDFILTSLIQKILTKKLQS